MTKVVIQNVEFKLVIEHTVGHFIKRFLSLNLNKTKCERDIIEIFYSFERPIDAIMCGI